MKCLTPLGEIFIGDISFEKREELETYRKKSRDLWDEDEYQEGRRKRSAVESLMFTLKYVFQFGRLRRRGIEAVKAEMLGIIIAYNYRHKIHKRRLAMTA